MHRFLRFKIRRSLLLAALAILLASHSAFAQDSGFGESFSPGLSDPLSESSATSGFNSVFDPSTANLTSGNIHSDISDDTHSQLAGSSISPLDNSYVSSSTQAAPQTGTLSNSQALTGFNNYSFGGRRSRTFSSTGAAGTIEAATERQSAMAGFGIQTGFASTAGGREAFSGQRSSASAGAAAGFSGEGVSIPTTVTGPGAAQTLASTGSADPIGGYNATDPVLSGDKNEADLELAGDAASPSSQTGTFFAETEPAERQFQFDDGQTPPISVPAHAGGILGTAPEYAPNPSGFPDSTKGLAGLAAETSNSTSPFAPASKPGETPFAPVSDGTVFGLTTLLNPNLHRLPNDSEKGSFEAVEHRAQEQRLTHGLTISQSSGIYQQDLRNYREHVGHRHSPTLEELENANRQGSSHSTMKEPVIR